MTIAIQQEIFDLYYAEKKSPIPGAKPDATLLTDEYRVLGSVSLKEAEDYILRFSHFRSSWRIQQVSA